MQRYGERIEKLSQQDRLSKFCTDAGFLTTVEVGQYFMTKDTEELSQFTDSVACREYTLPRDEDTSEPKGRITGNTKIGSVLEVTTCCLQGKYGVEIRIYVCEQRQFSLMCQNFSWLEWVGHKFEQQGAGRQRAGNLGNAVKIECRWFCKPIKGQSKTTKTRFCQLIHKNYTYWWKNLDWCWTRPRLSLRLSSVEETDPSSSSWKPTSRQWWSDWILENKRSSSERFSVLSSSVWPKVEEQHGRRRWTSDFPGTILYLRVLQGHSGRSLLDPLLQDKIIIPDGFFKYIYHVGCAINLHSIINSGLIPGGQNLSNRQKVFFLHVDPMDKEHRDPDTIDLGAPRLAQKIHKVWKKHKNTVYWVDINFALKKGLKFYQTRSDVIILHETLPSYCFPKAVRMETGEVMYEKAYASPRLPPKIFFKMFGWKNWVQKLLKSKSRSW